MSLLGAIALCLVPLAVGFAAGYFVGRSDRSLCRFVRQVRRLRMRCDVLELQRRARGEG